MTLLTSCATELGPAFRRLCARVTASPVTGRHVRTAAALAPRWRRLLLTVLGAGVLLGMFYLGMLATAYVLPGPLLVLPAALALLAVVVVTLHCRQDRAGTGTCPFVDRVRIVLRRGGAVAAHRWPRRHAARSAPAPDAPWPNRAARLAATSGGGHRA
jgi:hypothetical protein